MTDSLEQRLFGEYHLEGWQMSFDQRFALIGLLQKIHPELSIEIGTFRAGSLSAISAHSQHVYSLDIDPEIPQKYAGLFNNVDYLTGRSQDVLPKLLQEISAVQRKLSFVLIDGDHSRGGVRDDCNLILTYQPIVPLYIIMHDTINPAVRQGILEAKWAENPYVQEVHLDFVPGTFRDDPRKHNHQEMWGGLGLAVLSPSKRTGSLEIIERCHYMHNVMLTHSAHYRETSGLTKLLTGTRRFVRNWKRKFAQRN